MSYANKWKPTHEWVLRVPLIDGGGIHSKDHERIGLVLGAVEEHMIGAGVDSSGGVDSPYGDTVATWAIEECRQKGTDVRE